MEKYKQNNLALTLQNQELREVIQSYKVDNNKLNLLVFQQSQEKLKLQQTITGFVNTISLNLTKLLEAIYKTDCNISNILTNNSNISEVNNSHKSAYNLNLERRNNKTCSRQLSNSFSTALTEDNENLSDFQFIENSINLTTSENQLKNNNSLTNLNNRTQNLTELCETSNDPIPVDSIIDTSEEIYNVSNISNNNFNDELNSLQLTSKADVEYNLELNTIFEVSDLEQSSINQITTSTPFNKSNKKSSEHTTTLKQQKINPPYVVLKRFKINSNDNNEEKHDMANNNLNMRNKENIEKKRPRRSAQPKSMAEPKLNTKLRQPLTKRK